ncbi:MAG: hypothetical protein ACREOI_24355 [bacterium]
MQVIERFRAFTFEAEYVANSTNTIEQSCPHPRFFEPLPGPAKIIQTTVVAGLSKKLLRLVEIAAGQGGIGRRQYFWLVKKVRWRRHWKFPKRKNANEQVVKCRYQHSKPRGVLNDGGTRALSMI